MYSFDRRVYCKSQERIGKITERNYIGRPRRASYLVTFSDGSDYLTGSSDLRAADDYCDICGKWLPYSSFNGGYRGHVYISPDDSESFHGCFICRRIDERQPQENL